VYFMLQTFRAFRPSKDEQDILHEVLNNNSYYAHPENMILCMLTDPESRENRVKAIDLIKIVRAKVSEPKRGRGRKRIVRRFETPEINWNASSYDQMIDLSQIELFEPPVTVGFELKDLESCIDNWNHLNLPDIPSNNITLERFIKVSSGVTEQTKLDENRDGRILITLDHAKHRNERLAKPTQ